MDQIRVAPLDQLSCEREAIHVPGSVQAGATLLLFRPDTGCLAVASDNLEGLFTTAAASMIGCGLERFFSPEDSASLRRSLAREQEPVPRIYRLSTGALVWGNAFRTGGLLGLELTSIDNATDSQNLSGLALVSALEEIGLLTNNMLDENQLDIRALSSMIVERARAISGYDRAMMYRFDCDWNGEVIAESRASDIAETFLNHNFPSSDIPRQARELFLRNRVRMISDAQSPPVVLSAALNPLTGQPIDLSDCPMRAVAPVHLEYLRNMGVRATLSIALVAGGKLWGLVTCHHYRGPRALGPSATAACRFLCQSVSALLSRLLDRRQMMAVEQARALGRRMRGAVMDTAVIASPQSFLESHAPALLGLVDCDGMAFFSKDQLVALGSAPPEAVLRRLRPLVEQWLDAFGADAFVTNHSAGHWPELGPDLTEAGAGMVAVREEGGLSILFAFRRARPSVITWAGNPYKQPSATAGQPYPQPRRSFEQWREQTRDRALPWRPETATLVGGVKSALVEVDWIIQQRLAEEKLAQAKSAAEAAQAEMRHRALHDALTGLPNRRYLAEKMSDLVAQGASGREVALLHLDLDRFKQINDSLGHPVGDKVLCHVANVLRETIRRNDVAVRIGGDEFVVLCESGTEPASLIRMAQRIIEDLSKPLTIDGNVCRFGASVGIAREKLEGLDCETFISQADLALYDAKRSGRGRVSMFTASMKQQVLAAHHLRDDIQRGIEADEFRCVYHPQFDARTLEVVGIEALARWRHPHRGLLAPDAFLAIAEEMDVLDAIDAWILEGVVRDRARWIEAGHVAPRISVNVSARRLHSAGLVEAIRALNLPQGALAFELHESIDLDEPNAIRSWNIDGLRDLGVGIEIDDFGTGRTSIASLVRLKPDRLKINPQLIGPIIHSEAELNLVASIIEIGRTLGIGITAEGVETMAHAGKLRDIGCGVLQGFALSRPLAAEDLAPFLLSWRARAA